MKIDRAVVVFKRSSFDLYANVKKDRNFLRLLGERRPIVRRFLPSHRAHERSMRLVAETLDRLGIRAQFVHRSKKFSERGVDLVLTVGGDGTFLDASHGVRRAPILGINSNPEDSVGMFCGTTAPDLADFIDALRADAKKPTVMARLELSSDEHDLVPVLNDVLVANTNPAATSRFILEAKGERRDWKCSGIWIAPPAGSTGGVRSAGGKVLPIRSQSYQYVIREPYYPGPRPRGRAGALLGPDDEIVLHSKMRTGGLYVDGSHRRHPFSLGEKLCVRLSPTPLRVFGFNESRRRTFA